ncbi:NLR family CARD domain-containing protein 3-like [Alosa pseudoharengus]|uniref:NLR family CARD domain-containing protein 3-like n=1 Tax=Alosa pseudoharengus TaxID=34774 RepID=UPI003F8A8766
MASLALKEQGHEFFRKHRGELETRLGDLAPLLIELERYGVLSHLEREKVESKSISQEQNHVLITMLEKKGAVAQERFYEALKSHDPLLVEDLQRSAASPALPEPQQGRDAAAQAVTKSSLKQKLQNHLKSKFSTVHQDSKKCTIQDMCTDIYIVKGRTGGVSSEHEVAAIDMRQLGARPSSEDEQVKLADIFPANCAIKVLTLGIAGVGKSVAVQTFVMDWVEEKNNQDIDFVFVLLFRELNLEKGKQHSLFDLLLSYYPDVKGLKHFPEFCECKILFIFDGFDENTLKLDWNECISEPDKESSVDILVTSVIKGMLLSSALIWVTTRPAAASLIPEECFNLLTELQGFNNDQKIEFFQKNIKKPQNAKRIIDYLKKNRSLHIMCHIPVFCSIIASVQDEILRGECKDEPTKTLTEMYALYSVSQIKRMNDKYFDEKMSAEKKGQFLVLLGKLAFEHLEQGRLIFYEEDLQKCGIDANFGASQAGVCTQIFSVDSDAAGENMFSFVHLSIQEFLAALYVLNEMAQRTSNPLVKTLKEKISWRLRHSTFDLFKFAVEKALDSENGKFDLFVRFLFGLAPMLKPGIHSSLHMLLPHLCVREESINKTVEYIKEKIRKEDISSERTINLLHCLNELGDKSMVDEIMRYMSSADKEKNLTPAQCSTLTYLLLMSTEDLEEFDLKKYLRSKEGLRRMLPAVKVSRRVWLNHCNLSKTSCEIMASVLQRTPSYLRELDMSDNDLQDEGVELLCVGLRDPQCNLEILRLNSCNLSKEICEILASVLQRTPSHLRELDMSDNDLQDEGVELLCAGLRDPQCKLETLRLNHCKLSKMSCEMMASVLQRTPSHLRELDMSDNDLQDEGVELLCVGLRDPQCKLETLRLSGCQITHNGCSFLSSALNSNPFYLKQLDLSYSHPGDSGVSELTERLDDPNCKLETFRFDNGGECRIKPGPRKYSCELTLDPNTACRYLFLSEGNRKVTRVSQQHPYPDHPERFESSQVLCRDGLSGRYYWEAEWSGDDLVYIAVAYKSIQRISGSGKNSVFGHNAKSWSLECSGNSYSVWHNNKETAIPAPSSRSSRVGVYLDWSAGTLSFYSVSSNTLTHLHTFHSTFTEPLYPGFSVYYNIFMPYSNSSVSLC